MNGPEHYRQAEALTDQAHTVDPDFAVYLVAKAQVHATLALAAATATDRTAYVHEGFTATFIDDSSAWGEAIS